VFEGSYTDVNTISGFDHGELTNNGHTAKYSVSRPNDLKIREGPYGKEEYQFLQLHFHWGSVDEQGSEHTINGTKFPLEMHMVHINSKYVDGEGILNDTYAKESDGLAVLGFLFHVDDTANDTIESLTNGLSSLVTPNLTRRYTGGNAINAAFDMSKFISMVNVVDYYTYNGSLTTPKCNEVVTWVVFKHTIGIPSSVLSAFRGLKDSHGNPLVNNFRPTQPLNDRNIGNSQMSRFSYYVNDQPKIGCATGSGVSDKDECKQACENLRITVPNGNWQNDGKSCLAISKTTCKQSNSIGNKAYRICKQEV